jgi:hypothetical protein
MHNVAALLVLAFSAAVHAGTSGATFHVGVKMVRSASLSVTPPRVVFGADAGAPAPAILTRCGVEIVTGGQFDPREAEDSKGAVAFCDAKEWFRTRSRPPSSFDRAVALAPPLLRIGRFRGGP